MKYCVTFILFTFVIFLNALSHGGQNGADIFAESCRNGGENSGLIRTGYAEFECSENRQLPSKMIQKLVGGLESELKTNSSNAPAYVIKENLENIQRMAQKMAGKEDSKYRYKLFFTGNDVFFDLNADVCKRYRAVEQYDSEQKIWRLGEFAIMNGSPNAGSVFAGFMPGTRTATVDGQTRPGCEFQRFGRMQKSSAYYTMLQCMGQDRKKFLISEKTIQTFKDKMKEKNYTFETTGTDSYDGDKTATVVEIKCEGRVVERFWIDPSRGYICPLIQCFDEKGKIETECKSSGYFLHDKTGLWYPEKYEESRVIPFPMKSVYTLNRETFQLNQAVSDEMFTLDIPERTKVIDKRNGAEKIKYTAMEKGELSLKKGGLDLKKMKWLMREGDLTYGKEEPSAAAQGFRYVSMTTGIALITFALYTKYRKWRAKT